MVSFDFAKSICTLGNTNLPHLLGNLEAPGLISAKDRDFQQVETQCKPQGHISMSISCENTLCHLWQSLKGDEPHRPDGQTTGHR